MRLSQYAHRVWRIQDGAFNGRLTQIAQTPDGYLWIGTSSGLMRFDGVRVVPWVFSQPTRIARFGVAALAATEDGSLWVGTRPLLRIKDGVTTKYELKGSIGGFQADSNGGLWITQYLQRKEGPLCHAMGSEVKCLGAADGVDDREGASTVFQDKHGALWLAQQSKILTGRPGSFRTIPLPGTSATDFVYTVASITDAPDDSVLVAKLTNGKTVGLYEYKGDHWTPYNLPGFDGAKANINTMKRLKDGSLWIGTTSGLVVIRGQRVERFSVADGLSSNTVQDIVEDREGNVWVLTGDGLDSFRIPRVVTFSSRDGLGSGTAGVVLGSRDGSVYVGTTSGLDEIRGNTIYPVPGTAERTR